MFRKIGGLLAAAVVAVLVGASLASGAPSDSGTQAQLDRIDANAYAACVNAAGSSAAKLARCTSPPAPAPSPTTTVPATTPPPTTTTAPPPTTTQPPGADCAPYPAVPDASCTGWRHTGVTLRTIHVGDTGPGWSAETVGGSPVLYVRTAGAHLDSLDIGMCLKVMADNVTISRSRIACGSYYTVNVSDPPAYYSGLTLTDVEIDGLGDTTVPGIAVMGSAGSHYTRLDVHGFGSSGPRLASGAVVEDSWIHGFVCTPPDHSAGMSANDGGTGIVVRHNNVDINTTAAGCATAAWELAPDFGTYTNVTVTQNRFDGGAYCAYAAVTPGGTTGEVFTGNTFGRTYNPECGLFGPVAQWGSGSGNVWSGNVWGDGAAATSAHRTGDPVNP